jgi:hypothetical protein
LSPAKQVETKNELRTQALRDVAWVFQRLKALPWSDGRLKSLGEMIPVIEKLLDGLRALKEAEKAEKDLA